MLGYAAVCAIVVVWSTWLVVSRAGALSSLTAYDLALLRYGISGAIALPFVLYFKPWRTMPLGRIAALSILLGPLYILQVFGGFTFAPAAHGGIYMNGVLPVITLAICWIWLGEKARLPSLVGAAIILAGASLTVLDTTHFSFWDYWLGDLMFMGAAVFFSGYLVAGRLWHVGTLQILLCGAVVNAVLYLPVWYFFLPSGFAETSTQQLALQAAYQGLIPNLFGLILVATAVKNIGSETTSAIMAGVPGIGALLSMVILGEVLGLLSWLGIALLTLGIVFMSLMGNRKRT